MDAQPGNTDKGNTNHMRPDWPCGRSCKVYTCRLLHRVERRPSLGVARETFATEAELVLDMVMLVKHHGPRGGAGGLAALRHVQHTNMMHTS